MVSKAATAGQEEFPLSLHLGCRWRKRRQHPLVEGSVSALTRRRRGRRGVELVDHRIERGPGLAAGAGAQQGVDDPGGRRRRRRRARCKRRARAAWPTAAATVAGWAIFSKGSAGRTGRPAKPAIPATATWLTAVRRRSASGRPCPAHAGSCESSPARRRRRRRGLAS